LTSHLQAHLGCYHTRHQSRTHTLFTTVTLSELSHTHTHFTVLCSTLLYFTVLYCTLLYFTALYCTLLLYSTLQCFAALYSTLTSFRAGYNYSAVRSPESGVRSTTTPRFYSALLLRALRESQATLLSLPNFTSTQLVVLSYCRIVVLSYCRIVVHTLEMLPSPHTPPHVGWTAPSSLGRL